MYCIFFEFKLIKKVVCNLLECFFERYFQVGSLLVSVIWYSIFFLVCDLNLCVNGMMIDIVWKFDGNMCIYLWIIVDGRWEFNKLPYSTSWSVELQTITLAIKWHTWEIDLDNLCWLIHMYMRSEIIYQ